MTATDAIRGIFVDRPADVCSRAICLRGLGYDFVNIVILSHYQRAVHKNWIQSVSPVTMHPGFHARA